MMNIFFIPAIFTNIFGIIAAAAIIFIPSLWLFFRFMNIFTAGLGELFAEICEGITALFGKYISTFRNSGPLGKALCIAGAAAVILWIINWLRY